MRLEKYSFGTGDRFGMQGKAQLKAIKKAKDAGIDIVPVWNKSNREHQIIQTVPADVRREADKSVKELNWTENYYVDADHINLSNVDPFVEHSDFFTIDVADFIGKKAEKTDRERFIKENEKYTGKFTIEGLGDSYDLSSKELNNIAERYLYAIQKASEIYSYIRKKKGENNFIAEVSMDEVEDPQTPVELFFILSGLAAEGVPLQTIAPKFSGRFNKGVDYAGDIKQFKTEFEADLLVIDKAIKEFDLPSNLKLSVHSGSDKFTIYPIMGELIQKYDKGIHVKTAGTTWLEEAIGLALAGGKALEMVKSIYQKAYQRREELCGPYATVIDINEDFLPLPGEVEAWDGKQFALALRHDLNQPAYNPGMRQLIHVGYKIAAEYGNEYLEMLRNNEEIVGTQVTENIYERHIRRLFNI
ncbi:MAG: tagaturonate epimerase family protein [Bacteroidota bacterium]